MVICCCTIQKGAYLQYKSDNTQKEDPAQALIQPRGTGHSISRLAHTALKHVLCKQIDTRQLDVCLCHCAAQLAAHFAARQDAILQRLAADENLGPGVINPGHATHSTCPSLPLSTPAPFPMLPHQPVAAVWSSDLQRATQTAEALAGPLGLQVSRRALWPRTHYPASSRHSFSLVRHVLLVRTESQRQVRSRRCSC